MDDSLLSSFQNRSVESRARKRYGSRVDVSKLAPDILLGIFILLRDLQPETSSVSLDPDNAYDWTIQPETSLVFSGCDWTTLTRVCRNWRNVALEFPSLWTEIRITNVYFHVEKARAFLERSKYSELSVLIDVSGRSDYGFLNLFKGQMWRVREFTVALPDREFGNVKGRLLEMTKHAKTLALRCNRLLSNTASFGDLPDTLPEIQVNSLSLDSITFPFSNRLYHGLTKLEIANTEGTMDEPTVWQLFDILDHCPNLQHLKLRSLLSTEAFDGINISQIEARSRVLPDLRSISLDIMHFALIKGLFAMFSVNKDAQLSISFLDFPYHEFCIPALPSNFCRGRNECRNISLVFDRNTDFTIRSNYTTDSDDYSAPSDTSISMRGHCDIITLSCMSAVYHLLNVPFWKTADSALLSLEQCSPMNISDPTLFGRFWYFFIENLLSHTTAKSLTIKLPTTIVPEKINEFSNVMLASLSFSLGKRKEYHAVKYPYLEQLIIHFAIFSAGDYRNFLRNMEKRSRCLNRICRTRLVDCDLGTGRVQTEDLVHKPGAW